MSEPSINEEKLKLEIEKLRKELEKLTVEIPKLQRESGWRATVMPSIVSVAAVLVTGVVSLASFFNTQQTQKYEHDKADRELALNCVTSASVVANLVFDRSEKFDALPTGGKINFANVVLAAYPPSVADRFLHSLAPRLSPADADSRAAFTLAIARVEEAAAKQQVFPCPAVTEMIPVNVKSQELIDVAATSPTTPTDKPPAPSPSVTSPSTGASETVGLPLRVYYQVTQETDRRSADALAKEVGDISAGGPGVNFPSAGVEVVSGATALRQIEVRYYHRCQEDAAKQLLTHVQEAAHLDTGRVLFIGDTFPNLPQGRIEVWLPPLSQRSWSTSFCYQEQDPRKPSVRRYLVLCQPSKDECDKIRGPNQNTSQTACTVVDLAKTNWTPSIGVEGARYQFAPGPFGGPFPHL